MARKSRKLYQVAKELNLATTTVIDELQALEFEVTKKQMTVIPDDIYENLLKKHAPDRWSRMKEEMFRREAEEKEKIAEEVRKADLQKILDSAPAKEEKAPPKPAPSVRQLDINAQHEILSQNAANAAKALVSKETPVKDAHGQSMGDSSSRKKTPEIKSEDSGKHKKIKKEEPAKKTEQALPEPKEAKKKERPSKPLPTVRPSVTHLPEKQEETEVESTATSKTAPKRKSTMSVRGAVSNDDILTFTPPPTAPEVVEDEPPKRDTKEAPPHGKKAHTREMEEEDDSEDKQRRKKRRKRKTKKQAETKETGTPSSSGWVSTTERPAQPKRKRKRDRKKKVDAAEVQASIRQTMAAMEDSGHKRKKKRRVKANIGMVDEDTNLIRITEYVSTAELASLIDVPTGDLIRDCLMLGLRVTINQRLDKDTIQLLAEEHGYRVEFVDQATEEELLEEEEQVEEDVKLEPRAPVVTVMGHVDHGKTSLLDYIRHTHVVSGEAGGITQHIGAYEIEHQDQRITFLDTPGHEAFTAMRARGAQATDIVVLVVAADDQVMPQTLEAIDHAKAAEVPIVVAINKMDKAGANAEKVRRQLAEKNVIVEEYGGDIQSAEVSAKSGAGIDDLLDKILIAAEMLELQAPRDTYAKGIIIESRLDKGRGIVCSVLIQRGTLKVGDVFVAGPYLGRVRAMYDERGNKREMVIPGQPAEITGFDANPHVGDYLVVYTDEREAKQVASTRQIQLREQEMRLREGYSKTELLHTIDGTRKRELRLIIKGDVDGSVEAIADSLMRLSSEEVEVKIIHRGVGPINEPNVLLASASGAMIIGFNVHPHLKAREVAQRDNVPYKVYRIIYELIEDVKDILKGMHEKVFTDEIVGVAEVRQTFKISRVGVIAGCMVVQGKIERANKVRIIRNGTEIYQGELDTLKRFKDDAKEVQQGFECGIKVAGYNDIKVEDLIESLTQVEVEREIEVED